MKELYYILFQIPYVKYAGQSQIKVSRLFLIKDKMCAYCEGYLMTCDISSFRLRPYEEGSAGYYEIIWLRNTWRKSLNIGANND